MGYAPEAAVAQVIEVVVMAPLAIGKSHLAQTERRSVVVIGEAAERVHDIGQSAKRVKRVTLRHAIDGPVNHAAERVVLIIHHRIRPRADHR